MATKTFCDICGKELEYNCKGRLVISFPSNAETTKDICIECKNKLSAWLIKTKYEKGNK